MKKLSTYLFLILFSFSVPSFADDIRDFQIEGISIGDSLLDHVNEKYVEENKYCNYPNKKFCAVNLLSTKYKIYDLVQIHIMNNDNKYEIYNVQGVLKFKNNIQNCLKKRNEINNELKELFNIAESYDTGKTKHPGDPSGKSFLYENYFDINKDQIAVGCYDWSDKITLENGWYDNLKVSVDSKVFSDWLENEAFKK